MSTDPILTDLNLAVARAAGRLAGCAHNTLSHYNESDSALLNSGVLTRLQDALAAYDAAMEARTAYLLGAVHGAP